MGMQTRYRSVFWPAVLILIGVFALLVNSGVVPVERLDRLGDLWPLILIVIGLEIVIRRAVRGPAAELAAILVVLLAIVGAAAYVALGPSIPVGTQTLETSGKVGSLDHGTARVDAGAANITVRGSSSIGDDMYRAHIDYSGQRPDVSFDDSSGDLHISQSSASALFFQSRRFVLDLQLNTSVTWRITIDSGASSDTFDLSNVRLSGIELNGGAHREDITLGPPSGTVPITVDGGAITVNAHRPRGVAVSASVSGGAVTLVFDGRQHHAVGSASDLTGDFDSASDRYQIQANGGACTVTVDTNVPSS